MATILPETSCRTAIHPPAGLAEPWQLCHATGAGTIRLAFHDGFAVHRRPLHRIPI